MFEPFTDRARRIMAIANQEAQRANQQFIGPEYILLGLVKEGGGVGAGALTQLKFDLRKLQLDVEKLIRHRSEIVAENKLPQTPRAKKVIEYAIQEARSFKHKHIGSEHLLLGLIREQESLAAQALQAAGITLENARAAICDFLAAQNQSATENTRDRFTDAVRKTVALANDEAILLNHPFIGTEHLLIGLLRSETGVGSQALTGLNVKLDDVRREIGRLVLPGQRPITHRRLPLTPGSQSIFEFALEESTAHGHANVNTGHLLLALLRQKNGVAYQALAALGVTPQSVRRAVTESDWTD